MSVGLTFKQRHCFDILKQSIKDDGIPPSYTELASKLGLASKSSVHRLISALEERGYIRRIPNKARAIEILDKPTLPTLSIKPKAHPLDDHGTFLDVIAVPGVWELVSKKPDLSVRVLNLMKKSRS